MSVAREQRFTRLRPCPVCGGHNQAPRGKGERCFGFISEDEQWAHCTREEHAGGLERNVNSDTYAHRLTGGCRCGVRHDPSPMTNRSRRQRRIEETYDYGDANGELLFQVVRFSPKDFMQRRPDEAGDWIWSLNGIKRVLYRLPELLASDPKDTVYVVEGEKDADRLASAGLIATTNPGGAKKWREEYTAALAERRVVLIPDNDKEGREHAQRVTAQICGVAKSVKLLELPGLSEKGDVSDWLDAGGTTERLEHLTREAPESTPPPKAKPAIAGRLLSEVEPERVRWLWRNRIPLGKLTVLDGDPGLGKSAATTDFAARVSVGRTWPDGEECEAGGVVIASAEDGEADTIRPRLDAAGGDPSKVLALSTVADGDAERTLTIPEDLEIVRQGVERVDAKLVIVDPLMAFLSGRVNSHRDQDVRRALAPLARLAEATGAAVVVVRHLNQSGDSNPLYRGQGSIGIVGAARSGLLVAEHPEDDDLRVLAPQKSNLAASASSLAFALTEAPNGAVRVEWKGETNHTAAALLAAPTDPEERSTLDEAVEFLRDALKDGPMWSVQLKKDARSAGISEATLRRAKTALGIRSTKKRDGSWAWALPEDAQSPKASKDEHLEHLEHLPIDKPNPERQDGNQDTHDEHLQEFGEYPVDEPVFRSGNGQGAQGAQDSHVLGDGCLGK